MHAMFYLAISSELTIPIGLSLVEPSVCCLARYCSAGHKNEERARCFPGTFFAIV
jgi:hypothetical protein